MNDDYCDCPLDKSDEPNTSACYGSQFYCKNDGFEASYIDSRFVDDGYCDSIKCCDGSDERRIKCPNKCSQMADQRRIDRENAEKERRGGVESKKSLSKRGKAIRVKKLEEVRLLAIDLEKLVKSKNEAEAAKMKLEADGASAIIKPLSLWSELVHLVKSQFVKQAEIEEDEELLPSQEIIDDIADDSAEHESDDIEYPEQHGETFDELHKEMDQVLSEDPILNDKSIVRPPLPELEMTVNSEVLVEDDVVQNDTKVVPLTDAELKKEKAEELRKEKEKIFKERVETARQDISSIERKISDVEDKIIRLETEMNDYEDVHLSLLDNCIEYKDIEYTYHYCYFKTVKQGHTLLGNFESRKDNIQQFSNGEQCWNGPRRSVEVRLSCQKDEKIVSITEPNKCEYVMEVGSAIACEEFVSHDEL